MRDYSFHSLETYRRWQESKGLKPIDAFDYPCEPVCRPIVDQSESLHLWLMFRQEFLAKKYEALCFLVHTEWNLEKNQGTTPSCLLHFWRVFCDNGCVEQQLVVLLGTFASGRPRRHGLQHGASESPRPRQALLESWFQLQRPMAKTVHYEAATERVFPCTDDGKLQSVHTCCKRACKVQLMLVWIALESQTCVLRKQPWT